MNHILKWSTLWNLLSLIALGVLVAISFSEKTFVTQLYRSGYYIALVLLFLLWIQTLFRFSREAKFNFLDYLKCHKKGLLTALLFTIVLFISVGPRLRIFNDELNMISISLSMVESFHVAIIEEGYKVKDLFPEVIFSNAKRPALFPFFIHLIHLASGFRIENAFILNFILTVATLVMLYSFMERKYGYLGAVFGMILVVAQPIFGLVATSGGYELCALFFLMLSLVSAQKYIEHSNVLNFRMLWIHLILLAHIRPETPGYFLTTFTALFCFQLVKWRNFRPLYFYLLTSMSLFPFLWKKMVMGSIYSNIHYQRPDEISAFSINNFIKNSKESIESLFHLSFDFPYSTPINILGLLAVLVVCFKGIRGLRLGFDRKRMVFPVTLFANGIFFWCVFNAYWGGSASNPTSLRYYVVPCVLFSIMTSVMVNRYFKSKEVKPFLLIPALIGLLVYQPLVLNGEMFGNRDLKHYHHNTRDFLEQYPKKNVLIVSEVPRQMAIYGYPTVHIKRFNRHHKYFLEKLREGRFEDIIYIQRFNIQDHKIHRKSKMVSGVRYELIERRFMRNDYAMNFLRIL